MSATPSRPALPSIEELLSQLVAIPSINPAGRVAIPTHYGEQGMVDYLQTLLQPWADRIEIQQITPGRPNLLAYFRGQNSEQSYAFEAHTDTVDVAGMTVEPFAPVIRDGKLFGRGACDDKGPMVAMILAILRHLEAGKALPCDWWLLATCDEELGGSGAAHLVNSGFRCDGIIVAEPTGNQALIAHKGAVRYTLSVHGKAGHSAYPEHGANAIHAAADWITHLEQAVAELQPEESDPDARLTFSTGTINGGDQVNRIPDAVTLLTDWRVPHGMASEQVEKLLLEAANAVTSARPGIRCEYEQTQYYPPFAFDRNSAFARIVAPLFAKPAEPQTARYATNAGFYAQAGIPAVVFGPGSIEQAHRADEWIEIAQIEQAINHLRAVIEST